MTEEQDIKRKTLLLVDGSSYLYRAYYAMPDLRSPIGEPTGALCGIIKMMRRIRKKVLAEYSACVFDAKGKTFRNDLYPKYKEQRQSMPSDLVLQIEPIHTAIHALGWPLLIVKGIEADDVIGTLSRSAERSGMSVVISTGDKDLAQLVTSKVTLINTMTNETFDRDAVISKFGVPPERIVDYLTLIGDTVDNIPGVRKCGKKIAIKWLSKFGDLDGVIAHVTDIKGVVGDNLRQIVNFLPLARKLNMIETECDLTQHIESIEVSLLTGTESFNNLQEIFERYGLKSWF